MRAGFPTGTRMRRLSEEAHSLLGRRCVLDVRDNRFRKTLLYLLKHSFGLIICKLNTWHSNYNNYFPT
jgi:hypothetical protein